MTHHYYQLVEFVDQGRKLLDYGMRFVETAQHPRRAVESYGLKFYRRRSDEFKS
jgi:hypothetical protein